MPDFTRFGADVAEHTDKPPFDVVWRRGHRRRQMRAGGVAGAAAASFIAVVAVAGLNGSPPSEPAITPSEPPASPSDAVSPTSETPSADPEVLASQIANPGTELAGFSVGLDGSQLAQWQTASGNTILAISSEDSPEPRFTELGAGSLRITGAAPGGWIAEQDTDGGSVPLLISPEAEVQPLTTSRATPRPGDVSFPGLRSPFYRPATQTFHTIGANQRLLSSYITPSGTVIGVPDRPRPNVAEVVLLDGTESTSTELLTGDAVSIVALRGNGDHAAAVITRDPATELDGGFDLVEAIAITDDAGTRWRTVTGPGDVGDVGKPLVTASGSVLLTTFTGYQDQRVFRVRAGDDVLEEIETPRSNLTTQDGDLYAFDSDGVDRSTDDGDTWTRVAPPGK